MEPTTNKVLYKYTVHRRNTPGISPSSAHPPLLHVHLASLRRPSLSLPQLWPKISSLAPLADLPHLIPFASPALANVCGSASHRYECDTVVVAPPSHLSRASYLEVVSRIPDDFPALLWHAIVHAIFLILNLYQWHACLVAHH